MINLLNSMTEAESLKVIDQLQKTIYILLLIVGAAVVAGYFLYCKVREANRLLSDANTKLETQSTRDPLTGLLNRYAFYESMKARIQVVDRRISDYNQPPHALVLLDIDHFKLINDRFGHSAGDNVLIEVAHRLTQIMRENDKLMRWEGEEFLLFLNNVTTENLQRIIQRVLSVVGGVAISIDNKSLNVTISAGYISVAHGKESDVDANWEKSLKLADAALYKAKIDGRNQAVGIQVTGIENKDLVAMTTINLEELINMNKVVVNRIIGPIQDEKLENKFPADC